MSTAISASELRRRLDSPDRELAVLDLRSPLERIKGHIALSSGVPLHDLEQRVRAVVPRLTTPIVLASERALDELGAGILSSLGYTDVAVLEGGLDAWTAAGERLYTGTNVRSKTLGEWIEGVFGTRTVDSETVEQWRAAGDDVVVLDSRPHGEYVHHHIPGGYDTGGAAELAFRGLQAVPGSDTKIVVNCMTLPPWRNRWMRPAVSGLRSTQQCPSMQSRWQMTGEFDVESLGGELVLRPAGQPRAMRASAGEAGHRGSQRPR